MTARPQGRVHRKAIADLQPYPRNARRHPAQQIKKLSNSIARFGFVSPVLIDAHNGIIAGHARVQAAKAAGIQQVPCVVVDGLSDAEKRAYILADNRLAESATWDRDALTVELQSLLELDFDLELTGFGATEFDLLSSDQGNSAADGIPEVAVGPAVTLPGDLWRLGEHLLLCGDARQPEHYRRLLGSDKAALVVTDPPYNVPIDGHVCGLGRTHHHDFAMASGEMSPTEFTEFLENIFSLMALFSVNGAINFVTMDWRHSFEILNAGRRVFTELKNICVWRKTQPGMGTFYRSAHEFVFVWKNGKGSHINNFELGQHGRLRTNVWEYSAADLAGPTRNEGLKLHPTIKPVALFQDAMLDCSHRNGLVLDPFGGSGTVLIAAERARRKARALEIEPHYVDVAIRRWQSYTGEDALHAETGRSFRRTEAASKGGKRR